MRALLRGAALRLFFGAMPPPRASGAAILAAKVGRVATISAKAQALRSATQRRHAAAVKTWNASDKPDWLTEETYRARIQPRLSGVTVPAISSTLGVSEPYAAEIRAGRCIPHPRHWLVLARLVDGSPEV